jgi:hypothetical protein
MILWHIDPLLGNNHEISKYTTAVTENSFTNKHVPTAAVELQNEE